MNAAILPANVDEVLGIGAFAPVLTADQQAARATLIRDFTATADLFPEPDTRAEIAAMRLAFGLGYGPKVDAIRARMDSWANGGAENTRRVGSLLYSWTTNPRVQQNGAVIGRLYAQRRGELDRDIGSFKIDRDGNVLAFPGAARADFPGVEGAKEAS